MPFVLPRIGVKRRDPRRFEVVLVEEQSLVVHRWPSATKNKKGPQLMSKQLCDVGLASGQRPGTRDQRPRFWVEQRPTAEVESKPLQVLRKTRSERVAEEKQTMRLTDPVADMLARIRNAITARHQKVDIPASKLKVEIARILKEEGYISNYKPTEEEGHKVIRIYLKYGSNNEAAISNVERVSRPGCRVYVRRTEIPRVLGGLGINILTTPKGVMTGRQARKQGLGGELLCQVW
jgi:small subunit ribosomal protein S8